jgi:hypothetical protein
MQQEVVQKAAYPESVVDPLLSLQQEGQFQDPESFLQHPKDILDVFADATQQSAPNEIPGSSRMLECTYSSLPHVVAPITEDPSSCMLYSLTHRCHQMKLEGCEHIRFLHCLEHGIQTGHCLVIPAPGMWSIDVQDPAQMITVDIPGQGGVSFFPNVIEPVSFRAIVPCNMNTIHATAASRYPQLAENSLNSVDLLMGLRDADVLVELCFDQP